MIIPVGSCATPRGIAGALFQSALLLPLLLAGLTTGIEAQQAPIRVILFIGDGVGAGHWTAALVSVEDLAVKRFPVVGLVDTRNVDSSITDSAAGATAYASGVRTYNGALGVTPDSTAVPTVLERAQERGMAVGLVATSSVTHATPAAFAAHVPSRAMEFEIARQLLEHRPDVLLGGGRVWFDGEARPDSADLLGEIQREWTYVSTAAELQALDLREVDRLIGLFGENQLPLAEERSPTLREMTRAALEVLGRDAEGFFLMVEGSQPDWRAHANEPLPGVAVEVLDFDLAIGEALRYQDDHPETLIVVTADHETGGLAVQLAAERTLLSRAAARLDTLAASVAEARETLDNSRAHLADSTASYMGRLAAELRAEATARDGALTLVARYTSGTHTALMVPLFASGPGAESYGGMIDNWRVGELLLEAVQR